MFLLLVACNPAPTAVYGDRADFWLDRPFPSDELLVDGRVDLSTFPEAGTDLGTTFVRGWSEQATGSVTGWSHLSAIYFRFEAPLEGVEEGYAGVAEDPIRLIDLDTGEQVPIVVRFVADPQGDPFLAENTLMVAPEPTSPLQSGHTYRALVGEELASRPEGFTPHTDDDAAIDTVFTVQNSVGQLQALGEATEAALTTEHLTPATYRRVAKLGYAQGETPSGKAATVVTVTYEDGETALSYLDDFPDKAPFELDLLEDWPMAVYEAEIQTLAWQDLADQPYATPGVGLVADFQKREEGWIAFEDDQPTGTPVAEPMRVVIQVPRSEEGPFPVMTWDHGTGGHAYNAVHRSAPEDRQEEHAALYDEIGVIVVSRDQPLYGTRYPLIDKGFSAAIGFYNIGNLPAFRDNQRQAAVDHLVMWHFVTEQLPQDFEVLPQQVGTFGHSLGSVTSHLALAMAPNESSALMSGSGGYFTYYILETGLLGTDNSVVSALEPLLGVEDLASKAPNELLGALLGIPEPAWPGMDRMHPVTGLFQLIMDGSDPLAVAPAIPTDETFILGVEDYQVPNITTDWITEILDAQVVTCEATSDYDPHQCGFREDVGIAAFDTWLRDL